MHRRSILWRGVTEAARRLKSPQGGALFAEQRMAAPELTKHGTLGDIAKNRGRPEPCRPVGEPRVEEDSCFGEAEDLSQSR